MKSFEEYYDYFINENNTYEVDPSNEERMGIIGKYENPLTIDERNDRNIYINHTNLKNSMWLALQYSLVQYLIDWAREKNIKDLGGYEMDIFNDGDGIKYDGKVKNKNIDIDECTNVLIDFIEKFFTSNSDNIPNDWEMFSFGIDNLNYSIEFGKWAPVSDGYMILANPSNSVHYVCSM